MLFVLLLFDFWKVERGKIRRTEGSSIIILLQRDCQKIDRVSVLTACAGGMDQTFIEVRGSGGAYLVGADDLLQSRKLC